MELLNALLICYNSGLLVTYTNNEEIPQLAFSSDILNLILWHIDRLSLISSSHAQAICFLFAGNVCGSRED